MKTHCDYTGLGKLPYWRSTSGYKVDFILNDTIAIEVKAKHHITAAALKGLIALREENLMTRYIILCLAPTPRLIDDIEIMPYTKFLDEL